MSERRHPGPHPDADRLSAFMEGVLTEQERQESLAHLAECAECRSIVFLAQQPEPAPQAEPSVVPAWRRCMPPLYFAAAAVACTLVIVFWTRPHPAPVSIAKNAAVARHTVPILPPVTTTVPAAAPPRPAHAASSRQEFAEKKPAASKPQPPAPAPVLGEIGCSQTTQGAQAVAKQAPPPAVTSSQPQTAIAMRGAADQLAPAPGDGSAASAQRNHRNLASARVNSTLKQPTAAPASPAPGPFAAGSTVNGFLPADHTLRLTIQHNQGPDNGLSAIHGAVSDSSGAAIANARVSLRNAAGEIARATTTAADGRFMLPAIVPGQYELEISAPGFMTDSELLDLQARDLALLSPTLEAGAATQSVEVTAQDRGLATASPATDAQLAAIVPVLPGKLPAIAAVVKNSRILALDSSGTLYLSRDGGRRWKKVRRVWTGAIAHLGATPEASFSGSTPPIFELTTTDGAVWISRDGAHWRLR